MKKWSDDLVTGIEKIDRQHKDLFDTVHKLLIAVGEGKDEAEIGATIKRIAEYVYTHFTTEEAYMDRFQYPYASAHKTEHEKFSKELSGIKDQYERDGASKYLSLQLEGWLFGWLEEHVAGTDRQLAVFLKRKL